MPFKSRSLEFVLLQRRREEEKKKKYWIGLNAIIFKFETSRDARESRITQTNETEYYPWV